MTQDLAAERRDMERTPRDARTVIEVRGVVRNFGDVPALRHVSLTTRPGEVHALLGPNGAGKTTLLRLLTGLLIADEGDIRVLGVPIDEVGLRNYRKIFGFVPSGDRSFYLRLSGFENLVFFGRLAGLRKSGAARRARECLGEVGLADTGRKMVGLYSHGMQKRLSVARALMMDPAILYVDEATHDLDPDGARRVQDLVSARAANGTAVVWATQRLDEIRGFADRVTVLRRGEVAFYGTVPELTATTVARRYVVHLRADTGPSGDLAARAESALGAVAALSPIGGSSQEHYLLLLGEEGTLGTTLSLLEASGIRVLTCQEERSGIETAFLRLTREHVE